MTQAQETIMMLETFRDDPSLEEHPIGKRAISNYNLAIEAVKKYEPAKPTVKNTGEFDVFECPTCSFSVGFTNGINGSLYQHCTHCGQAIDWTTP